MKRLPEADSMADPKELRAYIVTGPTSGIGRAMALELANLVGRAPKKRDEVRRTLEKMGARAVPVVCDLSDIASVRRAAASDRRPAQQCRHAPAASYEDR